MSTTDSTIADQVAEFHLGSALPAEIGAAFADEQRGLDAAGLPAEVAAPGQPMPDGKLLDVHGQADHAAEARGGRPAVVVFYRGACGARTRHRRCASYQARLVPLAGPRGDVAADRGQPADRLTAARPHSSRPRS